jgi:hypothetical protein
MPKIAAIRAVRIPTQAMIFRPVQRGVEETETCNHINTGGDHGGSMDERGDRRWAGHGIGQPDIEWNLCGFTGGTDKQQQTDGQGYGGFKIANIGLEC